MRHTYPLLPKALTGLLQPLTGLLDHAVLRCVMLCSATGFVFQLHPADSRLTPATPLSTPGGSVTPRSTRRSTAAAAAAAGGASPSMSGFDSDEGDEEEVTFVPISLGTAEASMPDYLKVRGGCTCTAGVPTC
jgi:hypothetical protein